MRSIALACVYREANKVRVKVVDFGGGGAFSVLRDAIHRDLCMTLLKLFDGDRRSLSLERVLRQGQSSITDEVAAGRARELIAACESEEFSVSLRRLRNQNIAHNDFPASGHRAKYGFEMQLFERVIEIHSALDRAFGFGFDAHGVHLAQQVEAERFWSAFPSPKDLPPLARVSHSGNDD